MSKIKLLTGASALLLSLIPMSSPSWAEDCTSSSPIGLGGCTLDEDTNGALLIQSTATLSIDASTNGDAILINHTIDSDQEGVFGDIAVNNGGPFIITQNAAIGGTNAINALDIDDFNNGHTWNANADIITNDDGLDISLGSAAGGTVLNLNGSITVVGNIDGHTGDTINVNAGSGGVVTWTGGSSNTILNINSGELIANEQIGISAGTGHSAISIADGARLTVRDGAAASGTLDIDGDLYIGAGNPFVADTYTNADGDSGNIYIGILQAGGTVANGRLQINNLDGPQTEIDFSEDTFRVVIEEGSETLAEGTQTLTNVLLGTGGTMVLPTVIDDLFLYDYSLSNNAGSPENADLTITRRTLEETTNSAHNLQTAEVLLNTLTESSDDAIEAIQFVLNNASSEEEFNEALEATQPTIDAGVFRAAQNVNLQTRNMVQKRIHTILNTKKIKKTAALHKSRSYDDDLNTADITKIEPAAGNASGGGYIIPNRTQELALKRLRYLKRSKQVDETALSHQYSFAKKRFDAQKKEYKYDDRSFETWAEGFAGNGRQDRRGGIDGYEFDATGLAIGIDADSEDQKIILGSFLTYADTDIESGNANQTETTVSTYQAGFYGTYLYDDSSFLNGFLSISLNDVGSKRFNVGGTNLTANADYDGVFMNLGTEYGVLYDTGSNWMVTPSFGAYYSRMQFEDYRERGAGGANLSVSTDTIHRLDIGPSLTASAHYGLENGYSFIPEFTTSYNYNLLQSGVTSRAYMQDTTDDGDATLASELTYEGFDTQDHLFNLGMGANLTSDQWNILTHYNYQLNEDFSGHTATLKLNYSL